ncbi:MAG: nucleotidyltransferase domain-containing protein [Terrimicrobiaceae bacterium]
MRLSPSTVSFIKTSVQSLVPGSELLLFGSRANDSAKGGDIDLLLLTEKKLPLMLISKLRRLILSRIGEQKIDIVNFPKASKHPFKAIALETAVKL